MHLNRIKDCLLDKKGSQCATQGEEAILQKKLHDLHQQIQSWCGALSRIAMALYDEDTDTLKTFIHSSNGEIPLQHYQAKLSDVPSLKQLAETGESRVISDLYHLAGTNRKHTQFLLEAGYRSSYTVPLKFNDKLFGFLFFDSTVPGYFDSSLNIHLATYGQLIAAVVKSELSSLKMLQGVIHTVKEFSRHRDGETAAHLARMSHYSRLIGVTLADKYALNDEYIEYLFQFAGLHDLGKIALPDYVLLKTTPLSLEEYCVAQTHVNKGLELLEVLVKDFALDNLSHLPMLRNIIAYHHERLDGSGYPFALKDGAIPLESRIVAVADVFDALSSRRSYKEPWELDRVIDYMVSHAGRWFDSDCVEILVKNIPAIEAIRNRFEESFY